MYNLCYWKNILYKEGTQYIYYCLCNDFLIKCYDKYEHSHCWLSSSLTDRYTCMLKYMEDECPSTEV